jgi:hypothetical protein
MLNYEAGSDGGSDPEVDTEENTMESLILAQDER